MNHDGTRPTNLLPHLPNPDLARVYYRVRDGPVTVPALREELELSKSSAYSYIDELVDAGLLVKVADSQGATQYAATEWEITIKIDDESLTVGPVTALIVANGTEYPSIGRAIEEYGLETLQKCITEPRVYERGETTTRQFAGDTGLSYGLALEALAATAELLGFESTVEPMTSGDTPDDSVVDAEVDLSGLERGDDTSDHMSLLVIF